MMFTHLFLAVTILCVLVQPLQVASEPETQYFPTAIPRYEVRRDTYTNHTVSRGRLHLINYFASKHNGLPADSVEQRKKMIKIAAFQRHLQCASPEPELDGNRGSWSLLKMAPPTRQSIEQVCAWAETRCHPWADCKILVGKFKEGKFEPNIHDFVDRGGFSDAILMRIIDNKLYYDWPWGVERFEDHQEDYDFKLTDHYYVLELVLRLVSDIGDSVFFFGGEQAFSRIHLPFPIFSFSPSHQNSDFPFPWRESYKLEMDMERRAESSKNYSDGFYKKDQTPWTKRLPKAAFFANFQSYRQLVFDSAALRPDLFDVSFTVNGDLMEPWNPLSEERQPDGNVPVTSPNVSDRNHPGYLQPIMPFANDGAGKSYTPHRYKYVVVPVGQEDLSSSGRLAGLLAHSGAVVLLQMNTFSYHFGARLVPWVHYVPLSHSMAEIIEKVLWLKEHDEMAQQIVRNAENFAKSYLRLEDYMCYAASSLHLIHKLENTTDALKPFNPQPINRL